MAINLPEIVIVCFKSFDSKLNLRVLIFTYSLKWIKLAKMTSWFKKNIKINS